MSNESSALILCTMDFTSGETRLKSVIHALSRIGSIEAISSVYKKYLNNRQEDLNSDLVMALRLKTKLTPEELFHFLADLEKSSPPRARSYSVLLVYGSQIRLMPGQNLPSPVLHTDSLALRCASEAWGDYVHPVLGQTLNEIVRSKQPLSNAEFFAQGRSLFSMESL